MDTSDYELVESYGTPYEDKILEKKNSKFQSLTEINTTFPSALKNNS